MMRAAILSLPLACLLLTPVFPASVEAGIRMWTDANGVVHMSDDSGAAKPAPSQATTGGATMDSGALSSGARASRVRSMLARARLNPRYDELRAMALEYRKTHTYSMGDYFVCIDMALELANMLKTKGFAPIVVAGSPKADLGGAEIKSIREKSDHAWVVVELEPKVFVAVESTGGFVVDERIPHFDYYYQGIAFASPKEAKDANPLIQSIRDTCQTANSLVGNYNSVYAGRQKTEQSLEAKGRVDAKISECKERSGQYDQLIRQRFRSLY